MNAGKPFDHVVWIMLNPSTADAVTDDPTIRRCIGFTQRFGATGLTVVNLYAARATQPAVLQMLKDPVGPDNDAALHEILRDADIGGSPVICAWGVHARPDRVSTVVELLRCMINTPLCLGTTRAGHPRHPLYVAYTTLPQPWSPYPRSSAVRCLSRA